MLLLRFVAISVCFPGLGGSPARALDFTLEDYAATVIVSEGGSLPSIVASWSVGSEMVATQTLGLTARGDPHTMEPFITDTKVADTNFDPRVDTATVSVSGGGGTGLISLMLRGSLSDPSLSDLAETIEFVNQQAYPITFFQRVDFDDREVVIEEINENTVRATAGSLFFFEEVVTPGWDRLLINNEDGDFKLEGDIDPGETLLISKDKLIQVVPEPSTASLVGLCLAGLAMAGRRRSAIA